MPTSQTESAVDGSSDLEAKLLAALRPNAYPFARFFVNTSSIALGIFGASNSGLPLISKIALIVPVILTPALAFELFVLRRQVKNALVLLAGKRGI